MPVLLPMVAAALLLLHVPPAVGLVSVMVLPGHTVVAPFIVGLAFTVICVVV
jgi:hypothetical protein